MYGRMAVMAVLVTLAACANVQPAGRNARNGEMEAPPPPRAVATTPQPAPALPPPSAAAPAYTPPASSPAPLVTAPPASAPVTTAPPASAPAVAAPSVAAPAAERPPPQRDNDEEVVVPGAITRQVAPP